MNGSPPLHVYRRIATTFIAITIVLVFVIFYFTLTYAFVSIKPNPQEASYDYNITVTEDESKADLEKGVFAGTIINQEVQAERVFASTGQRSVVSEATGRVVISSTHSRAQPLVRTTRLLTSDNVLFRISESVVVPPGESVEVDVYQDDPEEPVSVKADDKFTIPGLNIDLQEIIYAEALSDFTGEVSTITFVTKGDLDAATDKLKEALTDELLVSLPADSEIILESEVVSMEFSNLAEDQADTFTASLTIKFTGAVADKDDLDAFKVRILETDLSDQVQLHEIKSTLYVVESVNLESDTLQVRAQVEGEAVIRKDADILNKDKMIGLNHQELITYLQNFKEVESADVRFFPFWVRSVPRFTDHIVIEIQQP